MRPFKIVVTLFYLLIFSKIMTAQQPPCDATLCLDLEILNANAQVFPIGDFNFAGATQTTNYFNIFIQNNGNTPINLSLTMVIKYNGTQIATGTSNSFELPANGIKYILSSQQLSLGTASIPNSNGNPQFIELSHYDVDLNAVGGLEDQAIQTGTAPSGNYNFILKANTDLVDTPIIDDVNPSNNSINITNPTYILLVIPGNSVNDPIIVEISTLYPFFQWQTDVSPGNASYDISVYQKYPEDNSTQDVLNHPAMLQVEKYPNNFLQYPTDTSPSEGFVTVRPLEAGNTYYWFVRSNILGPTGINTIDSDIFRFKISDLAQSGSNAQQILAILQQILGPNFQQVLTNLDERGFNPTGEINYNGRNGDINTLITLLNQVVSGQVSIQSVESTNK
jgi:hypothetical protein